MRVYARFRMFSIACIVVLELAQGDPFGDGDDVVLGDVFEQPIQKPLQASAVDQNQIGVRDLDQILRSGLVGVRVASRWEQDGQRDRLPADLLDDITQDGSGGDHFELLRQAGWLRKGGVLRAAGC